MRHLLRLQATNLALMQANRDRFPFYAIRSLVKFKTNMRQSSHIYLLEKSINFHS